MPIQGLIDHAHDLSQKVDWWNGAMLWTLILAAIAATLVVITTRMVILRSGQLADAQNEIIELKESEASLKIAAAQKAAGEANERAAEANEKTEREKLARLELERGVSPRRLTGEQRAELTKLLRRVKAGVAIVSPITDGEASDFADDLDSAIKGASWETLRIKNRITEKFGLSVVTATGTALPSIKLLDDALTAIGVLHNVSTVKDGDASISPAFQTGYLYLVVDHKPLPQHRSSVE